MFVLCLQGVPSWCEIIQYFQKVFHFSTDEKVLKSVKWTSLTRCVERESVV